MKWNDWAGVKPEELSTCVGGRLQIRAPVPHISRKRMGCSPACTMCQRCNRHCASRRAVNTAFAAAGLAAELTNPVAFPMNTCMLPTRAGALKTCVATLLSSILALASHAQIAPPPSSPASSANSSTSSSTAPIELSPFEVRAENDVGYQAGNTTSGSRLNSRLKDTPASISPFTPEFLSDIGATNLQEMLAHATNVEVELEDSQAGFNNPPGRDSTGGEYSFRIRGIVGGVSRDFVDATAPNDLYNVERAEMSSGPNSILFGLGPAGGLVSITGKKANVRRTRGTAKVVLAEHDFQRYEVDHNQVALRDRVAFRLLALHHTSETWRK